MRKTKFMAILLACFFSHAAGAHDGDLGAFFVGILIVLATMLILTILAIVLVVHQVRKARQWRAKLAQQAPDLSAPTISGFASMHNAEKAVFVGMTGVGLLAVIGLFAWPELRLIWDQMQAREAEALEQAERERAERAAAQPTVFANANLVAINRADFDQLGEKFPNYMGWPKTRQCQLIFWNDQVDQPIIAIWRAQNENDFLLYALEANEEISTDSERAAIDIFGQTIVSFQAKPPQLGESASIPFKIPFKLHNPLRSGQDSLHIEVHSQPICDLDQMQCDFKAGTDIPGFEDLRAREECSSPAWYHLFAPWMYEQ